MRRISAVSLVVLGGFGLIVGRLVRPIVEGNDGNAPRVGWSAAVALFLVAGIIGILAWNTWQSLHKRGDRMTSDHGIKMLSLAKASAWVGALCAGGYFGFALAFVDSMATAYGQERVIHAGLAGVAGLLMVVAGLLLERALRLPGGDNPAGDNEDATPA